MDTKALKAALLENPNARAIARQFNIAVHKIYYFAKTRKIKLRSSGRPQHHEITKKTLLQKVARALKSKNGLSRLSKRLNVPYYVVTNASKQLKLIAKKTKSGLSLENP
jgi:hypothetical protein